MNLSRRLQILPPYSYCVTCDWPETKDADDEAAAREHVERTGHEVRAVILTREVIIRPAAEPAEVSA